MRIKKNKTTHLRPKQKRRTSDIATKKLKSKQYPTYIEKKKSSEKLNFARKKIRKRKKWKTRIKRVILELSASVILLGILLYILSLFTFTVSKVEGYSMIPTLNHSEWVFVSKLADPKRFKLVLHRDPVSKETSVRRVIGLPNESVFYKDDQLYINGQDVFERFIEPEIKRAKASESKFTEDWASNNAIIPKGKYFVLGDNRPYASDSRDYGYIDEKDIVGVVEMRLLPFHLLQQF